MREPAQGQIIAGKYRIETLIGHGGMGSVWRARHESLDMPVAIKFMGAHTAGDLEAHQRFEREARALASLRTPNIVQVSDHGVDGETPYIVMELLEGEDLSTRILRKKRLGLGETSRILAQVARALRRAHEAGVTHRDLKPSNIFIAEVDGEEVVKVLDFGVAKLAAVGALGDQLTKVGTLLGSPGYMSPEQARGKDVDFRSDLWALAVIVFRALTGVKPFAGDSIAELVIKLCIDPRPVATRFAPDLPPAIDRFFEKAFAAEQQDRFQSAIEMASAFAQTIGQPGLELSRSGPSPISAAMRMESSGAIPAATSSSPSFAAAGGAAQTALGFPLPAAMIAGPAPLGGQGTGVLPPPPRPSQPRAASGGPVHGSGNLVQAQTMVLLPMPQPSGPSLAALREPTPTPASFGGFAPAIAETGSVAPSAGTAPPFPEGSLRAPPVGVAGPRGPSSSSQQPLASSSPTITHTPFARAPDAPDAPTPTGMRLHPPGPSVGAPTPPPRAAGAGGIDFKMLLFAAAGAAVLAIFFSLAVAGLRRRHANASAPHAADDIAPVPTVSAAPPATTTPDPATSAPSTTADVTTTGGPATAEPATTGEPAATSTAASTDEPTGTTAPGATQAAPQVPPVTKTATSPHPTTTPTTKSSGKTAPAPSGSAKKKKPKPNFGY
jgi:serine/threonine-protein kinase